MNKKIRNLFLFSAVTITGIHAINKFIDYTASLKNLTDASKGNYYSWNHGDIFYTKHGKGSPILLIHDLNSASSSYEWSHVIKKLEKTNTVYTLDLLGCGHSDKPGMTYTNYLYVQLLNDFIHEVIQEKTSVIATGTSGSFTIMSSIMNKDNFNKVIVINPEDLAKLNQTPTSKLNYLKKVIDCPIIGTFIYNIWMHEKNINELFEKRYYFKSSLISSKFEDIYYENAHVGNGKGRFLLSSMLSNYTNISITHALKQTDCLYLIGSRSLPGSVQTINHYCQYNPSIETAFISNCAYLPQLETPDKLCEILEMFLEA